MTAETAIDVCSSALYDDPWDTYRWLRDEDPFHRDERNDLWVVSRHADLTKVSRDPERYCNRRGVRPRGASDLSILAMDDPEHTRQRRLVNRGFTPRQVRAMLPHIREISEQVIDDIADRGEIDVVDDLAVHVPLIVIAEMLGLDPASRDDLHRWSDRMMAADGREDPEDPVLVAAGEAFGAYSAVLAELIAERRREPTDDLISVLSSAHAAGELAAKAEGRSEVPGREAVEALSEEDALDDHDLLMFLVTLLVAGNETTRNAISGGLLALSRFPDERRRLLDNLDDDVFVERAVEEIIRYVSPVLSFTRTVTEDHVYEGEDFSRPLEEGDRILLLYQSANRDERAFDRPDELVLDRDPNPHVAFGIGTHYCLGANLARAEVATVYRTLFSRLPDIEVPEGATGERGASSLVLALESLPAVFTPVHRPEA